MRSPSMSGDAIIFLGGFEMKSRRTVIRHPRKEQPIVWVIDSEQWPRACLRAELIERGYDAYGFIRVSDAFEALSQGTSMKPDVLILELRNQNLTAEMVQRIRNLAAPTILLGGNAELNDPTVQEQDWNVVLKRPTSLGKIADVTQQIISKHRTSA